MNLALALQPELLKTKRTASFYLTGLAAAFEPLMSLLDIFIGEGISPEQSKTIFNHMLTERFQMTGIVGLPMFIILICTLLPQVEYKNNAWKQVFAAPQSKASVFSAKFINVQILIAIFIVINFALIFLGAVILHFKEPGYHVLSQSLDWKTIVMVRIHAYLSVIGMCCIQFWLGLRFKNFIVPIAIGILCWFAGTLLVMPTKSPAALYFPYSFHVYANFKPLQDKLGHVEIMSMLYAVAALVVGYWDFGRKMKK